MDALALNHKLNILYREDNLVKRMELLHRWTKNGEVSFDGFKKLMVYCTEKQLNIDADRKSGKNIGKSY